MKKNAEIISIGSELLLGQICNTNAQFLSRELAEIGINVFYHTAVGDNADRLRRVVELAKERSNIIIFTGGLGPTKDDLTKETIASLLGKNLVMDSNALESIKNYFQKAKRIMTENNNKQALVLEGSYILPNDNGMAPGMAVDVGEEHIFMLLPGPPKELNPMFLNYGKNYLLKKFKSNEYIVSRVLRFFGIGESQLETDIEETIVKQSNPTIAPLAGAYDVTIRITAKHQSKEKANSLIDKVEHDILAKVGDYFYGYDNDSIFSVLFQKLSNKNWTISCAESLTGGLFAEKLTSLSGSSSIFEGGVVCYSNEVKQKILGVSSETLSNDGAVSEQTAIQLAEGIRSIMKTDIGISFTGVAGPNSMENKKVGTVYIGVALPNSQVKCYTLTIPGSRETIRERTVRYACHYLLKELC